MLLRIAALTRLHRLSIVSKGWVSSVHHSQPRVIWMGVEDLPSGKYKDHLFNNCTAYLLENLNYGALRLKSDHSRLTLRLRVIKQPLTPDEQQRLQRMLHSRLAGSSSAIYPVNTLCVMKSELSRSGAKYTCLKESSFSKSNSLS